MILGPRTGIKASTFALRVFITRVDDREYVSGTRSEFVDLVHSHNRWMVSGEVIWFNGAGRRSRISSRGIDLWDVCFIKWGRMWNNISCGVQR